MVFIGYRHVQHHSHNRLNPSRLRRFIKRHCRVQTIRIRQRHGRHFLLRRCRNDLLWRRHAPQKRIVTMTMQMCEHRSPGPEKGRRQARFSAGMLVNSNQVGDRK